MRILHHYYGSDCSRWKDYLLFAGIPLAFALLIGSADFKLGNDIINALITTASIFAGLLLNLLVLIYTIIIRIQDNPNKSNSAIRKKVLEQTFSNISFCILVSILLVVFCLLEMLGNEYICMVIPYGIFFLVPLMILTILMVLKRVHSLVASEF